MKRHILTAVLIACWAVGGAAQPGTVHVLKITAGPAGTERDGTFVFSEERAAFNRAEDKQVLVMFQWEGLPGPHKLEGRWRSPDGSYTSTSVIDYVARDRRFGAYWTLTTSPSMQLGLWSIEATVDGQPAGRFTFEITDAKVDAGPPTRRPLTEQEIYDLLLPRHVAITRALSGGREIDPAAGVLVRGGILTALRVLDAVETVRAVGAAGTQELTAVRASSRQEGWALLASTLEAPDPLPEGAAPRVGDRCYSMEAQGGGRSLVSGQITGLRDGASTTGGWIASFVNGLGTQGAPVVNEFGELLGILGASPRQGLRGAFRSGTTIEFGHIPVIPMPGLPASATGAATPLAELRASGALLEPLHGDSHVVSGGFATEIRRGATFVQPEFQRQEFSRADKELVVFVTWAARDRVRAQLTFHLYDAQNSVIGSSRPSRLNLPRNDLVMSSWKVPVPRAAGVYRAEVHLDGKPAWRDYVRVVE